MKTHRLVLAFAFVSSLVLPTLACGGQVGGLPVSLAGGILTTGPVDTTPTHASLRMSESKQNPTCGVEEPSDVQLVVELDRAGGLDVGRYEIGGKGERTATATLHITNTQCAPIVNVQRAIHGTIDVQRLALADTRGDNGGAHGTYDVVFDNGALKGIFGASSCVVAVDVDVDEPACDDVDHDGVPGGETGGADGGGD